MSIVQPIKLQEAGETERGFLPGAIQCAVLRSRSQFPPARVQYRVFNPFEQVYNACQSVKNEKKAG